MVGVLPGVHQNKHVVSTDAHHQKHNQKVQETKILNLQRDGDREDLNMWYKVLWC